MVIKYEDALIVLYYLGFWLKYFTGVSVLFYLFFFCGFCIFCAIYFLRNENVDSREYIKNLLIVLIACCGILINQNHTLGDGILLLSWVSIGILIAESDDSLFFFNKLNWITFIVLFIGTVLAYRNSVSDLDLIVSQRIGSNSIFIIALQCFFIDYICRKKSRKKTNYIMLASLMIISLLSRGKISILSTIVLVVGVYLQEDVKKIKKILRYSLVLFSAFALVVVFRNYLEKTILFFLQGDTNTRVYLWMHYYEMAKSSLLDILFGVRNNIFSTNYALNYYRNLHNTFLNWHYFYGIVPFFYYIFIIIGDFKREINNKDYIMVVLIIVSVLRGMTDEATFAFMMMWIYIAYYKRKESFLEEMISKDA